MLDDKYFEAALTVFLGRKYFGKEPHQLLKNGDEVFKALSTQREKYRVDNRWKPQCSHCNGSGSVPVDPDDWDCDDYVTARGVITK